MVVTVCVSLALFVSAMTNKNNSVDQVYCVKCHDYHNVSDVERIRIEAEYQGNETLFYTCPVFKETVSSIIHVGENE